MCCTMVVSRCTVCLQSLVCRLPLLVECFLTGSRPFGLCFPAHGWCKRALRAALLALHCPQHLQALHPYVCAVRLMHHVCHILPLLLLYQAMTSTKLL
jgi:hypothetical protein